MENHKKDQKCAQDISMAELILLFWELAVHTHVYMKQVDGAQAGATQIQINLSGELNVFRVQVKGL